MKVKTSTFFAKKTSQTTECSTRFFKELKIIKTITSIALFTHSKQNVYNRN